MSDLDVKELESTVVLAQRPENACDTCGHLAAGYMVNTYDYAGASVNRIYVTPFCVEHLPSDEDLAIAFTTKWNGEEVYIEIPPQSLNVP